MHVRRRIGRHCKRVVISDGVEGFCIDRYDSHDNDIYLRTKKGMFLGAKRSRTHISNENDKLCNIQ